MIHQTEKPSRANRFLVLSLLTLACLTLSAFMASGANAFTHTITDIEDPTVKAKVLGLDIGGKFSFSDQRSYMGMNLSGAGWSYQLSGQTGDSLTEGQFPKVTIQRDPTVVSLAGEVVTEEATGTASYGDFELCQGQRTTTKSPSLDVDLEGFYQSGTSSSTGNPEASISTQNLDPWEGSCSYDEPRTTDIQTFSTSTAADLYFGFHTGPLNVRPTWTPKDGDLTTVANGCAADYCDFTISGGNVNSGSSGNGSGEASTEFTLRLRLEYPVVQAPPPEEPTATPTPDTTITKGPKRSIKTKGKAKIAVRFESTGPAGTKFRCRLDKKPFSSCSSPFKRKVGPGKHRFAVVAAYQDKVDPSPAVHKWMVKKTKKKQKAQ